MGGHGEPFAFRQMEVPFNEMDGKALVEVRQAVADADSSCAASGFRILGHGHRQSGQHEFQRQDFPLILAGYERPSKLHAMGKDCRSVRSEAEHGGGIESFGSAG